MESIKSIYYILILILFMGEKTQAQDWANLNKYQTENASIKPLEPGQKRIVLMGDSITEFWSVHNPEFFAGKPYINRGISGQTSPQILLRFRADGMALKPSVIVLLAGVNDIAGNTGPSTLEMIMDNISSMAEMAKANQIKIILCSVLPSIDFWWKPGQNPAEKIVNLNKMIKQYADANDILYLDYYSVMENEQMGIKSAYSDDGAHPNKIGYEVMDPLLEKAIADVLSKK